MDYGPMQMKIIAVKNRAFVLDVAREAAKVAINHLLQLIESQAWARKTWIYWDAARISAKIPLSLKIMWSAVRESGDPTLTPMASVAGALADLTADWLVDQGATRVVVDNGGDIAIRLTPGESIRVGISPGAGKSGIAGYIDINGCQGVGGIATSGLGGKSFTAGIADSAVILAKKAAVADACATSVGNHTIADHPLIKRLPARLIDPNTDIPDVLVTKSVGQLPEAVILKACRKSYLRAIELIKKRVIIASIILCQGYQISAPPELNISWLQHEKKGA